MMVSKHTHVYEPLYKAIIKHWDNFVRLTIREKILCFNDPGQITRACIHANLVILLILNFTSLLGFFWLQFYY